jgi:hypothetical protein
VVINKASVWGFIIKRRPLISIGRAQLTISLSLKQKLLAIGENRVGNCILVILLRDPETQTFLKMGYRNPSISKFLSVEMVLSKE